MSVAPSLLRDDKCLDGRILRWGWWVSAGRGRGSKEYGVVYEALYSWVISETLRRRKLRLSSRPFRRSDAACCGVFPLCCGPPGTQVQSKHPNASNSASKPWTHAHTLRRLRPTLSANLPLRHLRHPCLDRYFSLPRSGRVSTLAWRPGGGSPRGPSRAARAGRRRPARTSCHCFAAAASVASLSAMCDWYLPEP